MAGNVEEETSMDKILTVNDVAEILQVKPITVREMFRAQRLRGFKIGKAWRIAESTLEEDLAAMSTGESPGKQEAAPRQASSSGGQSNRLPHAAAQKTSSGTPDSDAPNNGGPETRKRRKRTPSKEAPEAEQEKQDTQQLLF